MHITSLIALVVSKAIVPVYLLNELYRAIKHLHTLLFQYETRYYSHVSSFHQTR
jgi:hypothetical protein